MADKNGAETRSWHDGDAEAATSLSLLSLAKRRDDDAWHKLVLQYGPLVHKWCIQSRVPGQDALDVVQEVLQSVARAIGDFHHDQQGDSFRKWLRTITKNKVRDYFRRVKHRPVARGGTTALIRIQEERDPLGDGSSVETDSSGNDAACFPTGVPRQVLEKIRDQVKAQTWEAFWLTVVEERAPADVAVELQMSVGSVYQARSRILARLRKELGEVSSSPAQHGM